MRKSPYGEIIVAMVTPFKEDLSVNYTLSKNLAKRLTDEGVDGVLLCGTTGESPTLTMEEKLRLVSEVRDYLPQKVTVWAGASSYNTKDSVELSRLSEKAGADGILAVTPYYNKPSQEGLFQHFKAIAEAVSLPIMLYNVPSRTGVNLLPDTCLKLSELKNVAAIKEASGNLDQASAILRSCKEGFYVYSGDDSLTLPMLSVGASGVVSVAAHLIAKDMRRMVDYYMEGNIQEAREIHLKFFGLFKALFVTTNPIPVKTMLEMAGFNVGSFRLPLCNPTAKEKELMETTLESLGLIR